MMASILLAIEALREARHLLLRSWAHFNSVSFSLHRGDVHTLQLVSIWLQQFSIGLRQENFLATP
jgi:hypothetical protein